MTPKKHVVLLHGIGRKPKAMKAIQVFLQDKGYTVHNIGYPSRRQKIEDLANELVKGPLSQLKQGKEEVNFVVHSMGGLVLRYILKFHDPFPIGKVVMLATPNHGSELCDHFKHYSWFRWWFGPAGRQLGTSKNAFPQQLGEANFECGIITGDRGLALASRWIKEPHDGRVSVESSKLEGAKDHLVLPVGHCNMLKNKEVHSAMLHFLEHGWFQKSY